MSWQIMGPGTTIDHGPENGSYEKGFSKYDHDAQDRDGDGRACFNCGRIGHNKAKCPIPRQLTGACNSCGKDGHTFKECPDTEPMECRRCKKVGHMAKDCDLPIVCPRCGDSHLVRDCSMPMICRICEQEGHLSRDCPSALPRLCFNCQEEGHDAAGCKAPRKIDRENIPVLAPEDIFKLLRQAVQDRDLNDIKAAVQIYAKAYPETTYEDIEKVLRAEDIKLYLIGIEKTDMTSTLTNMDLQGNLGKKFTVTYRFQDRPSRPREKTIWPGSNDENFARLREGGEPVARGVPLCSNCRELGHIYRNCPTEKMEVLDKVVVACYNCGETGHRVRDCRTARADRFACRNCGQGGHSAKECTEPRSAENVECRNCSEVGHFSKNCPNGGGQGTCRNCGQESHMARDCTEPRKMTCRNCDQEGHASRDCPEPRNMAKVQCRNCDEYGHVSKECSALRNMGRVQCSNCQGMGHFRSSCKTNQEGADSYDAAAGNELTSNNFFGNDFTGNDAAGNNAADNSAETNSVW